MPAYPSHDRLVIFDADGTTVDAFHAVQQTFIRHGMALGDLTRFQKRRKLFKYLGGLREFPTNLRQQFGKQSRKKLLQSLTEFYREEARLYPGVPELLQTLLASPGVRVALVTRNVTMEPEKTLAQLFHRHGVALSEFDHLSCIGLSEDKSLEFRQVRERMAINPALAYACGDEYSDYLAARRAGIVPFVVAYGSEDRERLQRVFEVPFEHISGSPQEFAARLLHTLGLANGAPTRSGLPRDDAETGTPGVFHVRQADALAPLRPQPPILNGSPC